MGEFYCHIDPKKATDINKAQGVKTGNVFFECFDIKNVYRNLQQSGWDLDSVYKLENQKIVEEYFILFGQP